MTRQAPLARRPRADGQTDRREVIRLCLRLTGRLSSEERLAEVVCQEFGSAKTPARIGLCKVFRQRRGRAGWYRGQESVNSELLCGVRFGEEGTE